MNNEITAIRNAKQSGSSEIAKLLTPYMRFKYTRSVAEYALEAKMIARLIADVGDKFHADIASRLIADEKITGNEASALASKFCSIKFTLGQFKKINEHLFDEEKSEEEKLFDAKFDANS